MIHIPTWENELKVIEITQPLPVEEWLQKSTGPGCELEILPYNSLIAGGRYDGGHVVLVHDSEEENTYMFAVPSEAIPLLQGLLPDDQYSKLMERTPSLAGIAAREHQ
jgi:hypothetical protein